MAKAVVINPLIDTLPFNEALSWEKFQVFCTDLLYKTVDSIDTREFLLKGSSQQGIDVYSVPRNGEKITVAQCKLMEYLGPQQVLNLIDEFLKGSLVRDTGQFILCTSADLGRLRDEEGTIYEAKRKLQPYGIHFIVWDQRGLSRELRSNSPDLINIVYRYFGEQVASAFYGNVWADYIRKLKTIQKRTYPFPIDYIERNVISYQERLSKGKDDNWYFWGLHDKQTLASLIESSIGKESKRILLLSTAGYGKTEELKHLAGYFSNNEKLVHPIRFFLRDYEGQSIEEILTGYDLDWRNIPNEYLLLVLDGLDEISQQQFQTFINRLNAFIELHPKSNVVVSSRYNFYNVRSNELRGFDICLLNPLSHYDIEAYLDKKLGDRKQLFTDILAERYFTDYLDNPYYLTRLTRFYNENVGTFPKNKSELFEKIQFEKVERDADRYRIPELKKQLLPVARKIAFCMTIAGKSSLTDEELTTIVHNAEVRENLKHFGIFNRSSESVDSWTFEHKNLQEYLCASVFVSRSFSEVQRIISFKHDTEKLLPRFLNTVSFLFELAGKESMLFQDLFSWINSTEPELLIRFEREQLSLETRRKIFEKIFNSYKSKGITLRISQHLSTNELASFVEVDEWMISYLGKELRDGLSSGLAYDALEIIGAHKRPFLVQDLIQDLLFFVLNNSYSTFVKAHAIEVLSETGLASQNTFERILSSTIMLQDFEIRRACISLLSKADYAEEYLDFILSSIPVFEAGQREMTWAGSDSMIKALLLRFDKPLSIKHIFQYCVTNSNMISLHSNYKEFHFELNEVKTLLAKGAIAYKENKAILPVIYRLFCNLEYLVVWNEWFAPFKEFFEKTCGTKVIFTKFYRYGKEKREMMSFADEEDCDFLTTKFENGELDQQQMTLFQNALSWVDYRLFRRWNQKLNEITKNTFVYQDLDVNYNEIDEVQEKKNQYLLLDKKLFLEEANAIFDIVCKDKISSSELWVFSNKDLKKFRASIVLNAIRDECRSDSEKVISRGRFMESFGSQIKWEGFIVTTVKNWLEARDAKPIIPEVRKKVEEWCTGRIEALSFEGAIRDSDQPGSFTMNSHRDFVINLFLKLKIDIEDRLLLKLLPMDINSFSNSEESIGSLVIEKVKDRCLLKETVLKNIKNGGLASPVLSNHFTICHRLKYTECLGYLYRAIIDNTHFNEYTRKEIAEYYLDLGGNILDFERYLTIPEESENSRYAAWQWYLIENFLVHSPQKVKDILLQILNDEKQTTNKIKASECLIRISQIEGLTYWANHIKQFGEIPMRRHWENLQEGIIGMPSDAAIRVFFDVLEHFFKQESASNRDSREIDDMVFAGLISLSKKDHANYLVIKNKILKIVESNFGLSNLDKLIIFSERLTQNYFESFVQEMDISSANLIYEQFVVA